MWHSEQQRSFDPKKKKKNHLPTYTFLPHASHPSTSALLQLVQPSTQSCRTQNNKVKQSCDTQSNKELLIKKKKNSLTKSSIHSFASRFSSFHLCIYQELLLQAKLENINFNCGRLFYYQ
jgi:hypothetical protein